MSEEGTDQPLLTRVLTSGQMLHRLRVSLGLPAYIGDLEMHLEELIRRHNAALFDWHN